MLFVKRYINKLIDIRKFKIINLYYIKYSKKKICGFFFKK